MKSLGQIAYEAYCATTNWKSAISGAPLPPWEMQKEPVMLAWDAAGEALRMHFGGGYFITHNRELTSLFPGRFTVAEIKETLKVHPVDTLSIVVDDELVEQTETVELFIGTKIITTQPIGLNS